MTAAWLPVDYLADVTPPITGGTTYRSATVLEQVVDQFEVDTHGRYAPRDVTGDGKKETFCNVFAADVSRGLACPIPRDRANAQAEWLEGPHGQAHGWRPASRDEAISRSTLGLPVLATWHSTNGGPGHIAVVIPHRGSVEVQIAQAGGSCFSRGGLSRGFGSLPVRFFTHD
jgi:hypothetical protein